MQAFVHGGSIVTVPAPREVNDGDGVIVGALFGVAKSWSSPGEPVELMTVGVFDLRKPADEVWNVGDKIFWSTECNHASNQSCGLPFVGIALESTKPGGTALGRVRITGSTG